MIKYELHDSIAIPCKDVLSLLKTLVCIRPKVESILSSLSSVGRASVTNAAALYAVCV